MIEAFITHEHARQKDAETAREFGCHARGPNHMQNKAVKKKYRTISLQNLR